MVISLTAIWQNMVDSYGTEVKMVINEMRKLHNDKSIINWFTWNSISTQLILSYMKEHYLERTFIYFLRGYVQVLIIYNTKIKVSIHIFLYI